MPGLDVGSLLRKRVRHSGTHYRLRVSEPPVAVVVRLALLGVGKLQGGPRGVHAQALALDETVAVADLYYLRQRQICPELPVLRPRDPEHALRPEVGFKLREHVVELRPAPREEVDVAELSGQLRGDIKAGRVDLCPRGLGGVYEDRAGSFL